jgi:hypothetical protein
MAFGCRFGHNKYQHKNTIIPFPTKIKIKKNEKHNFSAGIVFYLKMALKKASKWYIT